MDITLHALGSENSSGTSASFSSSNMGLVGLFVNVGAVSGTLPTLVVNIQQSPNNTDWYDVPNLTTLSVVNVTTASILLSNVQPLCDYVRCKWSIGGVNPVFTFAADLVVYRI